MIFSDFEFNGKRLSHYNCILGNSGEVTLEESISMHSPLVLNSFKQTGSRKNKLTSASYDDVLTAKFSIVKINCSDDDIYLSDHELNSIAQWLSPREYKPLKVCYDDGSFYDTIFYAVCTEISTNRLGNGIVGLTLTFTTNAPYGFSEPITVQKTLQANETWDVYPDSDEIGILLPNKITITLNDTPPIKTIVEADPARDIAEVRATYFKLTNSMDTGFLELTDFEPGSVITMDCQNKIIEAVDGTDDLVLNLQNKFNYFYPRLIVDREGLSVKANTFTANTDCDIEIEYQLARKIGVVI